MKTIKAEKESITIQFSWKEIDVLSDLWEIGSDQLGEVPDLIKEESKNPITFTMAVMDEENLKSILYEFNKFQLYRFFREHVRFFREHGGENGIEGQIVDSYLKKWLDSTEKNIRKQREEKNNHE